MAPPVRIQVLGGFGVDTEQGHLDAGDLCGNKPRQVLEALVLARGTPVSKERVIDLLWAAEAPRNVLATLESYVSVLRRTLQPGTPVRDSLIRTVAGGYAIDVHRVEVDLYSFDLLADACRRGGVGVDAFAEAIRLGSADLLPGSLGDWVATARALHDRRVGELLVRGARAALVAHEVGRALEWAGQAVDRDGLDEEAWEVLLAAQIAAGRPTDGLRAYERCRRALAEELGCSPGPTLRHRHATLLDLAAEDDGALADAVAAVVRLHDVLTTHVPMPRSSLVEARRVIGRLLDATG
ncbi:MAG: BTAD domain-containing putative transcriptional regulator [Actinomycetes bacterium]